MTLEQLIARQREQVNTRISLRNQYATELEELRGADSVDEVKVEELRGKKAGLDAEITALRSKLTELEDEQRADDAAARLQREHTPSGAPESRGGEKDRAVVTEKRTYAPETDPQGLRFLSDVAADFLGNRQAGQRLEQHMAEERVERGEQLARAVTTGGAPGLVVPQYLIDMYAPKGRPGRRFADQCRQHNLPDTGMTVYIPRQTAMAEVAEQVNELDTVAENDYDDELISVKVRTAAGSQTISRQSVERSLGTEDIVFEDLLKSYDVNLDKMLITSPVWGLLAVANPITYTDADPTAAELYRKILGAAANVEDVLEDADEDDVFTLMRGRRWAWLSGEVTDKKPFIAQPGVPQGFGNSEGNGYAVPNGVRGYLPNGGPVVTDNNLPKGLGVGTNEDAVVVVARQEAHLWEDPAAPLFIRAETGPNTKKLGIDLVVYGYFAACFDRVVDSQGSPKAVHQKITGTGLVAPTF
ncbi:hypothetical protein [Actinotalea sp. JY-7876]|uniref:hypothetical protein n=1 Tax=Actinotalea sp. JY-7876 TaxID=2758442 RepID=UPI0015F6809D|nr:hypothetical protein [Actinotalea sp. JY-7876]